jgi:choline/carnitine/betaine transport
MLLLVVLIMWTVVFPADAGAMLSSLNRVVLANFGAWYVYVTAFYLITCLGLALWPATGARRLGQPGERPQFSDFSWFSMMFGAGVGIGMLTYSTAEPIHHFVSNPDVILGAVAGEAAATVRSTYKWAFLHWGLTAWSIYAIVGLSLAFFSYSRGLPLTIRSGLTPLFGRLLSGPLGHVVDIAGVIATVLGVAVTIGYGARQLASGVFSLTGAHWMSVDGRPTMAAILVALLVVMSASTWSALSGVMRGIKWLSNLNMALTFAFLAFFLLFGSTLFGLESYAVGLFDYLLALPGMAFSVWSSDGSDGGAALAAWQSEWTVFYWAWWIAFAPFVGLFLARISRGRTIREYIIGAIVLPSLMCLAWLTLVGGTAIDLELNGGANRAILDADLSAQLFATLELLLSPTLYAVMSVAVVVLLITYLVTSADSAILIINTINSGGDEGPKTRAHIAIWGAAITVVIAGLLLAGGLGAVQTAMIIGALPFSVVIALLAVAMIKALIRDGMRARRSGACADPRRCVDM